MIRAAQRARRGRGAAQAGIAQAVTGPGPQQGRDEHYTVAEQDRLQKVIYALQLQVMHKFLRLDSAGDSVAESALSFSHLNT